MVFDWLLKWIPMKFRHTRINQNKLFCRKSIFKTLYYCLCLETLYCHSAHNYAVPILATAQFWSQNGSMLLSVVLLPMIFFSLLQKPSTDVENWNGTVMSVAIWCIVFKSISFDALLVFPTEGGWGKSEINKAVNLLVYLEIGILVQKRSCWEWENCKPSVFFQN